jgi:magnesium transporter
MLGTFLHPEIDELIRQRNFSALRDALLELHPEDIGEILRDVPPNEQCVIFRLLPRETAAGVVERMNSSAQRRLMRSLGRKEAAEILNAMTPDDRTALLEDLPEALKTQLLRVLSPEEYRIASQLLAYPSDSVGRRMTTQFVAVRDDWTVAQVLRHLRQRKGHGGLTAEVLYVTDAAGRLVGDLRLRDLVLAETSTVVAQLVNRDVESLRVTDDQETAVRFFQRTGRSSIPVVDSHNMLVGIVTADDVLRIQQRETTEDVLRLGAVEDLGGPYLQVDLFQMLGKRAGWLCALFLGEMLTATAMGYYEEEIARAVVLALFIPLVISSGGNSGSQASTLIVRAMALQNVRLGDWFRVMRRELLAGLVLGSILGTIAFVRIAVWPTRVQLYGEHYLRVAFTVGTALVGVVMFGTVTGSMLPFVLRRLGFDPAVASAPFVATLVDVTGLVIYFTVASILLAGSLL